MVSRFGVRAAALGRRGERRPEEAYMSRAHLSALDASFLAVETSCAHMHVGWAAVFEPPADEPPPTFAECRDHIAARLSRAPRFRQMLSPAPLGLGAQTWVDDPAFDVARHVTRSRARELTGAIDWFLSQPLRRDRPLWNVCVADQLDDGRVAVIGKAHHCMVDGIAAVELASLLVDPEPDPPEPEADGWMPQLAPGRAARFADALVHAARERLDLAAIPARVARSPQLAVALAERAERAARALADAARPARDSSLNRQISPARHLARTGRPMDDLLRIKRAFGVKLNDVILAVCAGGVRQLLRDHGERPIRLKSMVPVNVRGAESSSELGNRISFMFIDLPCDEPDALRRLREVHMATSERKRAKQPEGGADVLRSLSLVPGPIQRLASRLIASPRAFNLTVSNIPGPGEPLYMRGCRLVEAYPVVPIADGHTVSIGVTTVGDGAYFGLYADPESLPDADLLAEAIDASIDELLEAESFAAAPEPILD
jgi:diacylglycerol O-acyltransferase / wax synthase